MAGAFSGHLLEQFAARKGQHPIPFDSTDTSLMISGAMSFNPQMHGTPIMGNRSMNDTFCFNATQSSFFNADISEATQLKIAALQSKLNQKLGPEYISQRPGPGGGPKLTYAEGWKIINLANEVFGFNGWSSNIVSLTTDYIDYNEESKRYNVGVTAIVRVTLRDGVFHEDIGYGLLENSKSKGAAFDKCKKEAVTDGLKRALRNFGNLLGNCLYDKSYTQEVVKIKVQPPKFDQNSLYRRPEFDNTKPSAASTSISVHSAPNPVSAKTTSDAVVTSNHVGAPRSVTLGSSHTGGTSNNTKPPSKSGPQTTSHVSIARPALERTGSTTASLNYNKADLTVNSPSNAVAPAPRQQSESPSEYHDETFPFCSDDDALLALVDLGEGDLGQPLLPETDLGRPIDDDDNDPSFSAIFIRSNEAGPSRNASFSRDNELVQTIGGQPQSTTRPQGAGQYQPRPQQATTSFSKPLLQNQPQPQNVQRTPHLQANMPQHQKNHHSNIQNKPLSAPRPNENQFQPNLNRPQGNSHQQQVQRTPSMQTTTPVTTRRRPSTPSVGGFHFPPGVDPNVRPQAHGSGIGVKRPLNAMSTSTNSSSTGMNGGANMQVKREVLGEIELDVGGNAKRTRR